MLHVWVVCLCEAVDAACVGGCLCEAVDACVGWGWLSV